MIKLPPTKGNETLAGTSTKTFKIKVTSDISRNIRKPNKYLNNMACINTLENS